MAECGACNAIAGGIRGQFDAMRLRGVLGTAGISDPALTDAVDTLDRAARHVTQAGVVALENELIGTLIDVRG